MGITIYIPAVVLNTVIGLSYVISVVGIISLVIVFTLLGGLKAAITADVIQGVLMIIVSLGFVIQGVYDAGGVTKVIDINQINGKDRSFFNCYMKFVNITQTICRSFEILLRHW